MTQTHDTKREAVLLDMDGSAVDVRAIRHFVKPTPERPFKAFNKFHEESVNMPPHQWVVDLVRDLHAAGIDIIIVTARKVMWARHTAMWLALHDVPSDALFMRGDRDGRADVEVKRDILAAIRHTWNPVLAIDDNPSIVELWRQEGIFVVEVPGWEVNS